MSQEQNEKKVYLPLAEADYRVRLIQAEEAPTKNGKGTMVSARFEVMKGLNDDDKKRLIFESFLTTHTTPKAQEIGHDRLSKFLKAVGVEDGFEGIGNDATALMDYEGLPFTATVGIKPPQEYEVNGEKRVSKARNYIKAFAKL